MNNTWLRRFHLIATVGGGFAGLAICLATVTGNWAQLKASAVVLMLAFAALCVWAIYLGVKLFEGRDVRRGLRFFYIIQLLNFTTPWFSFHAGFGLMLYLGVLADGQNFRIQLGADWTTSFLSGDSWSVAINVVPIIVLSIMNRLSNET